MKRSNRGKRLVAGYAQVITGGVVTHQRGNLPATLKKAKNPQPDLIDINLGNKEIIQIDKGTTPAGISVLHINIAGRCVYRIYGAGKIHFTDNTVRKK